MTGPFLDFLDRLANLLAGGTPPYRAVAPKGHVNIDSPLRVRHTVTAELGYATQQVDKLSHYDDTVGGWVHVEWDDGFRCWVTNSDLDLWTVFGWTPATVGQP